MVSRETLLKLWVQLHQTEFFSIDDRVIVRERESTQKKSEAVSAIEPYQVANNAYNYYRHVQMATRIYMRLNISQTCAQNMESFMLSHSPEQLHIYIYVCSIYIYPQIQTKNEQKLIE